MNKSSTTIHDPQTGGSKTFTFDHSHWSHDGYKVNEKGISEPESQLSPYSDQVLYKKFKFYTSQVKIMKSVEILST